MAPPTAGLFLRRMEFCDKDTRVEYFRALLGTGSQAVLTAGQKFFISPCNTATAAGPFH